MFTLELIDIKNLPEKETVLSKGELFSYDHFKTEKRKNEWLGGRVALKKAVSKIIKDLNPKDINASYDVLKGSPVLTVKGEVMPYSISISHCGDWAGAVLSAEEHKHLGLDIERIEPRPASWMEDYFHKTELIDTDDTFLTELWTKKEAVLKALGLGLKANLMDIRFENGLPVFYNYIYDVWTQLNCPKIKTISNHDHSGYVITVAFDEPNGGNLNGRVN
jgi:phosphopantetheinyl transferase